MNEETELEYISNLTKKIGGQFSKLTNKTKTQEDKPRLEVHP